MDMESNFFLREKSKCRMDYGVSYQHFSEEYLRETVQDREPISNKPLSKLPLPKSFHNNYSQPLTLSPYGLHSFICIVPLPGNSLPPSQSQTLSDNSSDILNIGQDLKGHLPLSIHLTSESPYCQMVNLISVTLLFLSDSLLHH